MSNFQGITISERMVSAFPISIGTSLALESIFQPMQSPYDPERKIPQKVDIGDYDTMYVNLATLYRNLVGSMEKHTFSLAHADDLIATLLDEIDVIQSLFLGEAGKTVVKFYLADHGTLKRNVSFGRYVGVKLRESSTENQKFYAAQEATCLKALSSFSDSVLKFSDAFECSQRERALLLTHLPYDLINHRGFDQLDLIESNTGVLKGRHRWCTKYHPMGERDMSHLPFHKKLLFVFGDKYEIKPGPKGLRDEVYRVSVERNWTPATTLDKVKLDVSVAVMDPAIVAMFKSYE